MYNDYKKRDVVQLAVRYWMDTFSLYYKLRHHVLNKDNISEEEHYRLVMHVIDVVLNRSKVNIQVFGEDKIPDDRSIFVCANHQDKYDPLFLWKSFPYQLGFVVEKLASKKIVVKEVTELLRSVILDHTDLKQMYTAIGKLKDELLSGYNYMIFPEGKYTSDPAVVSEFMAGCFRPVLETGATILPVAIIDSYKIFGGSFLPPYDVQVHYLDPIYPDEYIGMKTKELSKEVHLRIQSTIDRYQTT